MKTVIVIKCRCVAHRMESLDADHVGCRRPLLSVQELWSLLLKLASIKCSIIATYNLTGYIKSTLNSQDSSVSDYFAAFYYYCALEVIYVYLSVWGNTAYLCILCVSVWGNIVASTHHFPRLLL